MTRIARRTTRHFLVDFSISNGGRIYAVHRPQLNSPCRDQAEGLPLVIRRLGKRLGNSQVCLKHKKSIAQAAELLYYGSMLGRDKFYSSTTDGTFEQHGATTAFGKLLRTTEAKRILEGLNSHLAEFEQRDTEVRQIEDRIARITAAQRLHLDFMISFGVDARDREAFREVLEKTVNDGRLTPPEMRTIAKSRSMVHEYQ